MNDATAIALANALVNNNTLKELILSYNDDMYHHPWMVRNFKSIVQPIKHHEHIPVQPHTSEIWRFLVILEASTELEICPIGVTPQQRKQQKGSGTPQSH